MKGLKIVLWICAVSFLLSLVFAAGPWDWTKAIFRLGGIKPPAEEAITVFVFRLFMLTLGLVGVFFALLARDPLAYGAMLPLAAFGLMVCGLTELAGGIRYGLPAWAMLTFAMLGLIVMVGRRKRLPQDWLNARHAWAFTLFGITIAAATVHLWSALFVAWAR